MIEAFLGPQKQHLRLRLVCVEYLLGCILGFHTPEREGKGRQLVQRIRLGSDVVSAKTSCDPLESSEAGVAFQISFLLQ